MKALTSSREGAKARKKQGKGLGTDFFLRAFAPSREKSDLLGMPVAGAMWTGKKKAAIARGFFVSA
jgi:hypothetical protein